MRKFKKNFNNGITLIALVITIIVLLILAGVSIAMLTGDNGILTQANKSQVSTIEGNVQEAVKLAVQAAKMDAEQKAISSTTAWAAQDHRDEVIDVLNDDLLTGYTVENASEAGKITITYAGDDYKKATNNTNASITYTLTLTGTKFELSTATYVK